jgi:hypothetical protein
MENLSQDIIKFIEKIVDKLRFEWEVTAIDKPDKVKPILEYKINNDQSLEIDEKIVLGYYEFISGTGYVFNLVLETRVLSFEESFDGIKIDNPDLVDLENVTVIRNCKPNFYHGTYIDVNKELDTSKEIFSDAIYPAVILWEVIRQNFEADHTSIIGNTPRLTLSFLDTTNKLDWTNDEQYYNVVDPMENLADTFIKICDKHPYLAKLENYTYTKHTNWGKVVQDRGHVKYLLDENLAGLNLEIDLPVKKACLNKFAKI